MSLELKILAAILLAVAAAPGDLRAPALKANQSYAFNDTVSSKSSTAVTGTGLSYKLPDPSYVESTQKILRTISVIAFDDHGLPSQFRISYGENQAPESAVTVAGREFDVRVTPGAVDVTSKDARDLSSGDRSYVVNEATKFIDYLAASEEFTTLTLSTTDYQDISSQLISKLLGLPQDQVQKASIKREQNADSRTFDIRLVLVGGQNQHAGDVEMSGTMQIKDDWSSFDTLLQNKTTRSATYENTQIKIDTTWSIALSRQLDKQ